MKYEKQPLTYEEQADQLIKRGLIADKTSLIKRLQATSYFRISGYLQQFRKTDSDNYKKGTTLEQVWRLCLFDQRLRTLVLDAIEAIEVFTRTQLAYKFAHQFGPFDYHNPAYFPNLRQDYFRTWQEKLTTQIERSRISEEQFLVHFFDVYGDEHTRPTIWHLVELMDFGSTLTFYKSVNRRTQTEIAEMVSVPERVFQSWLLALNTVRNRSAHHLRLWDWSSRNRVLTPSNNKYPEWHQPALPTDRIGIILTICKHLLDQISPTNTWSDRLYAHFDHFPEIDLFQMGLPGDWRSHPLWT